MQFSKPKPPKTMGMVILSTAVVELSGCVIVLFFGLLEKNPSKVANT